MMAIRKAVQQVTICYHGGEAAGVASNYYQLTEAEQDK
jgi:hypothetical protein